MYLNFFIGSRNSAVNVTALLDSGSSINIVSKEFHYSMTNFQPSDVCVVLANNQTFTFNILYLHKNYGESPGTG